MRLNFGMDIKDMIYKMSDGNPGAINVMCVLLKELKGKGAIAIFYLDEMGIYGSNIWICAKDICKNDFKTFEEKIFNRTLKKELELLKENK